MDHLSQEDRSALMSRIRSSDTGPELKVRRLAHSMGLRFRLKRRDLPGSPDLVFPRYRLAVFVHGCFWHRHPGCVRATLPKSRVEFWIEKRRLTPVLQIFYDEPEQGRFEEMRRIRFTDIREVQGRPVPHAYIIEIANEPEKQTRFEIEEMRFDEPIPDSLFTLTELKRAEAVR